MSQINSNTKDDLKVVLLLSCFVGHPVPKFECCALNIDPFDNTVNYILTISVVGRINKIECTSDLQLL